MSLPRQSWFDLVVGVVTSIGCSALILWLVTADPLLDPGGGLAAPGWAVVWAVAALLLAAATWLSAPQAPAHGAAGLVVLLGWIGPLLASIPQASDLARATGYAAGVLLPIALVTMLAQPDRGPAHHLLLVAWAASAGAAFVVLIGYNPLHDPACARYCVPIEGPLSGWPQEVVRAVVLLLVAGSLVAGLGAVRITSRRIRSVVVAGLAAAAVMLTWRIALPHPWHREDVAALAVLMVSALVTADRMAVKRRRQAARSAAAILLADPGASLQAFESIPRDALTGAERLALSNAQLTLQLHAEVTSLKESRRRIVDQADEERHRLGRELHDGVQQRVVGTTLHVGALAASADGQQRRDLDQVLALLTSSLAPLRTVTRRGAPPLLESDGLATALRHRAADAAGTTLVLVGADDQPEAEAARQAYIVVDALLDAPALGARELGVTMAEDTIAVRLTGGPRCLPESVRDRVLAAGGEVIEDGRGLPGTVEVRLPCES